jgi:hypothetical protein
VKERHAVSATSPLKKKSKKVLPNREGYIDTMVPGIKVMDGIILEFQGE